MNTSLLTLLALASAAPGEDPAELVEIACFLDAESTSAGSQATIFVELLLEEGFDASKAGAPALFLQLDVPASVELDGPYLRSHRELSQNEFLQLPFERLMETNPTTVGFTFKSAPAPGEAIEMNVIGYVDTGDGDAFFLRRRLRLPLELGGEAEVIDPSSSAWGEDEKLLRIGDTAPAFTLPRPDGTTFDVSQWLSKKNVIVTTYRAFW